MMRTGKAALTAVVMPLLLGGPVWGEVLYEDTFGDSSIERPGKIVDTAHGRGWQAGVLHDRDRIDFLRFPVAETLTPGSGTIEMELIRGEREEEEGLFAFADDDGRSLLFVMLDWNGIRQDRFPEVRIDFHRMVSGGQLWYRTYTKKYWNWNKTRVTATKDHRINTVVLNETISRGKSVHLTFTWGPTADRCAIYLNGRKLDAEVGDPLVMKKAIAMASWLTVGGFHWGSTGGDIYLNSTLEYFRTYDSVENGELLYRDPQRHESGKGR